MIVIRIRIALVPLSMSSIAKSSCRHIETNNEFLGSYLQALDILCDKALKDAHPFYGCAPLYTSSLVLPCLFCGRHTVELAVKILICKCDTDWIPDGHSLSGLWNVFSTKYPKEQRQRYDERVIRNMSSFINILDKYDATGFNFRYGFAKDGRTPSISAWAFVNLVEFKRLVHEFVSQVLTFQMLQKESEDR